MCVWCMCQAARREGMPTQCRFISFPVPVRVCVLARVGDRNRQTEQLYTRVFFCCIDTHTHRDTHTHTNSPHVSAFQSLSSPAPSSSTLPPSFSDRRRRHLECFSKCHLINYLKPCSERKQRKVYRKIWTNSKIRTNNFKLPTLFM